MSIGWIILGATGNIGLAVTRQRCCVNREEDQEFISLQCVDEWPLGRLQANGDRATKAFMQALSSFLDHFRLVFNNTKFHSGGTCPLQAEIMFAARPIDADIGGKKCSCS